MLIPSRFYWNLIDDPRIPYTALDTVSNVIHLYHQTLHSYWAWPTPTSLSKIFDLRHSFDDDSNQPFPPNTLGFLVVNDQCSPINPSLGVVVVLKWNVVSLSSLYSRSSSNDLTNGFSFAVSDHTWLLGWSNLASAPHPQFPLSSIGIVPFLRIIWV